MHTQFKKLLFPLLVALLAPWGRASVVYTWHGTCVDRYLSNSNSPDIGGCAAVNGIVSGALGVPDAYVLGTPYAFSGAVCPTPGTLPLMLLGLLALRQKNKMTALL